VEEQQEAIQNIEKTELKLEKDLPDDTDNVNPEEEYEAWRLREMKRIKRDLEGREMRTLLNSEIERRRQMTEEERREDDARIDELHPKESKKQKMLFMQKYYHKGAFFQDKAQNGEDIYNRDFNEPVPEDAIDKKILPKVMRVRRGQFGRQGQVKHTHLVDVDTTDFTAAWALNEKIQRKYQKRLAGPKGENIFERPTSKKET